MTLQETIENSIAADRAYSESLRQNGYKTRWCKHNGNTMVMAALAAKIIADNAMHDAFAAARPSNFYAADGVQLYKDGSIL